MKITLIQADLLWNDPAGNRARFEQKIAEAGSSDLIVLPEMFSTGFCTQPRLAAEPYGGETLPWMKRIAQDTNCALAGSVAVEENGSYFNRFYFVKPDGSVSQYDKRHLFTYGGEHKEFTAGNKRVIVEYKGWRILLQICYDLRFPVWSRNKNDYDLVLYTANWPTPRVEAWSALLRARAIENLCYVAGINRTGTDPNCSYCGKSALLDFKGQTLADVEPGKEALLSAELDADALRDFRKNFPALQDADRFTLE